MFTFTTPCLRWKILVAYKGQCGWPGLLPPYATRYLAMTVTITDDESQLAYPFGGLLWPNGGGITTNQYSFAIDRITGRPLPGGTPGIDPQFPYGLDTAQDMADHPGSTWEVN